MVQVILDFWRQDGYLQDEGQVMLLNGALAPSFFSNHGRPGPGPAPVHPLRRRPSLLGAFSLQHGSHPRLMSNRWSPRPAPLPVRSPSHHLLSRPAPRPARYGRAPRVRLLVCVRADALQGHGALPSPGFHLGVPAARRSIWTNLPSTGNPSLTWTLHWISFIIVTDNFGAGKSLEDGLGEPKRTEVAKDLRFDRTGSLYERIRRFKRGSGKSNQNPAQDFDLRDALDLRTTTKPPLKKKDFDLRDALDLRTTTKPPLKKKESESLGFDLSDALDDNNDGFNGGGGRPNIKPGERITDKDLEDILGGGGYKPDKGRGDGRYDSSNDDSGTGTVAETGTIAGIASALAMALIGAVSSYISYQQKKFCFSIQPEGEEGANRDYVKGQSLEGVSTDEKTSRFSALPTQSAEKPLEETLKI
ncbi:CD99 antigen-like protein 2 [Dromiciops gliroides]|uniref:CD99 antigen-like protein 2 n=1 Tax=Dromiciops gliroides TaxID=33562 RepID=UPI001CC4A8C5|nr:CD99 antigen-like protein 2 [Dromiciops gliroides]